MFSFGQLISPLGGLKTKRDNSKLSLEKSLVPDFSLSEANTDPASGEGASRVTIPGSEYSSADSELSGMLSHGPQDFVDFSRSDLDSSGTSNELITSESDDTSRFKGNQLSSSSVYPPSSNFSSSEMNSSSPPRRPLPDQSVFETVTGRSSMASSRVAPRSPVSIRHIVPPTPVRTPLYASHRPRFLEEKDPLSENQTLLACSPTGSEFQSMDFLLSPMKSLSMSSSRRHGSYTLGSSSSHAYMSLSAKSNAYRESLSAGDALHINDLEDIDEANSSGDENTADTHSSKKSRPSSHDYDLSPSALATTKPSEYDSSDKAFSSSRTEIFTKPPDDIIYQAGTNVPSAFNSNSYSSSSINISSSIGGVSSNHSYGMKSSQIWNDSSSALSKNQLHYLGGTDSLRNSALNVPLSPSFTRDFTLFSELGIGGFSRVLEAQWKFDNNRYAVKCSLSIMRSTRERDQKLREFRMYIRAGVHENLVHYRIAWQEEGILYFAMELCPGGTMKSLQADYARFYRSPLPSDFLWIFIGHVASGLSHLHRRGVVHLDIKPENILLGKSADDRWVFKIGDLGLSTEFIRDSHDISSLNRSDMSEDDLEGDSRYMAAELLESGNRRPPADIFSLGLTAFELVWDYEIPKEGPPWHAVREGRLPSLPVHRRSVDPELVRFVSKMLAPVPADRPTAGDILNHPRVIEALKDPQALKLVDEVLSQLGQGSGRMDSCNKILFSPSNSKNNATVDAATGVMSETDRDGVTPPSLLTQHRVENTSVPFPVASEMAIINSNLNIPPKLSTFGRAPSFLDARIGADAGVTASIPIFSNSSAPRSSILQSNAEEKTTADGYRIFCALPSNACALSDNENEVDSEEEKFVDFDDEDNDSYSSNPISSRFNGYGGVAVGPTRAAHASRSRIADLDNDDLYTGMAENGMDAADAEVSLLSSSYSHNSSLNSSNPQSSALLPNSTKPYYSQNNLNFGDIQVEADFTVQKPNLPLNSSIQSSVASMSNGAWVGNSTTQMSAKKSDLSVSFSNNILMNENNNSVNVGEVNSYYDAVDASKLNLSSLFEKEVLDNDRTDLDASIDSVRSRLFGADASTSIDVDPDLLPLNQDQLGQMTEKVGVNGPLGIFSGRNGRRSRLFEYSRLSSTASHPSRTFNSNSAYNVHPAGSKWDSDDGSDLNSKSMSFSKPLNCYVPNVPQSTFKVYEDPLELPNNSNNGGGLNSSLNCSGLEGTEILNRSLMFDDIEVNTSTVSGITGLKPSSNTSMTSFSNATNAKKNNDTFQDDHTHKSTLLPITFNLPSSGCVENSNPVGGSSLGSNSTSSYNSNPIGSARKHPRERYARASAIAADSGSSDSIVSRNSTAPITNINNHPTATSPAIRVIRGPNAGGVSAHLIRKNMALLTGPEACADAVDDIAPTDSTIRNISSLFEEAEPASTSVPPLTPLPDRSVSDLGMLAGASISPDAACTPHAKRPNVRASPHPFSPRTALFSGSEENMQNLENSSNSNTMQDLSVVPSPVEALPPSYPLERGPSRGLLAQLKSSTFASDTPTWQPRTSSSSGNNAHTEWSVGIRGFVDSRPSQEDLLQGIPLLMRPIPLPVLDARNRVEFSEDHPLSQSAPSHRPDSRMDTEIDLEPELDFNGEPLYPLDNFNNNISTTDKESAFAIPSISGGALAKHIRPIRSDSLQSVGKDGFVTPMPMIAQPSHLVSQTKGLSHSSAGLASSCQRSVPAAPARLRVNSGFSAEIDDNNSNGVGGLTSDISKTFSSNIAGKQGAQSVYSFLNGNISPYDTANASLNTLSHRDRVDSAGSSVSCNSPSADGFVVASTAQQYRTQSFPRGAHQSVLGQGMRRGLQLSIPISRHPSDNDCSTPTLDGFTTPMDGISIDRMHWNR